MHRTIRRGILLFSAIALAAAIPGAAQEAPEGFGEIDQSIVISTIRTQMKYDVQSFTVRPGAKVKLTFRNPDELPHNIIICTPGSTGGKDKGEELIKAVLELGARGQELGWEPKGHPRILHSSGMIQPGKETVIWFEAPRQEGNYPYVCTYPGHFTLMNGMMTVSRKSSPGVVRGKARKDPFYTSPGMRRRPQVRRIFMPEAGPAAIAVAVNDDLHYCWDAGQCRLRYVWKGDFVDGWDVWKGNGNGLASIEGEVLHREEASPLDLGTEAGTEAGSPRFRGYSLQDGLPTFRWEQGGTQVEERIQPSKGGKSLERIFVIKGAAKATAKPKSSKQLDLVVSQSTTLPGNGNGSRISITMTPQP